MPSATGSEHAVEAPQEDALAVYLRGHVAGSHGAEAIARRLQDRSPDPALRAFLAAFVEDVVHERALIEELLEEIEGSAGLLRRGASAVADAATRLGGALTQEVSPGPVVDLGEHRERAPQQALAPHPDRERLEVGGRAR